ncbi:MAG: DUF3025 domain-containing protein [Deltaproteobacteria bacterium]|nr:DUF3025 domain-containing protein [Myxococcales bacterium]MDP3221224.1 DUF3025 domain-containing protein [Deltaproteobacteria bacterium]
MSRPPWSAAFVDAPWASALLPAAQRLRDLADWPTLDELNDRLGPLVNPAGVGPVRFAASPPRSRRAKLRSVESLYDVRIHRDGLISTRLANAHDLFNALVWAMFPWAKRALARRQHDAHLRRLGAEVRALPNARSREQDTLAMIDEGGVLEGPAGGALFGHALYEHLFDGHADVRGYAVRLDAGPSDAALAAALSDVARFLAPGGAAAVPLRVALRPEGAVR